MPKSPPGKAFLLPPAFMALAIELSQEVLDKYAFFVAWKHIFDDYCAMACCSFMQDIIGNYL